MQAVSAARKNLVMDKLDDQYPIRRDRKAFRKRNVRLWLAQPYRALRLNGRQFLQQCRLETGEFHRTLAEAVAPRRHADPLAN